MYIPEGIKFTFTVKVLHQANIFEVSQKTSKKWGVMKGNNIHMLIV